MGRVGRSGHAGRPDEPLKLDHFRFWTNRRHHPSGTPAMRMPRIKRLAPARNCSSPENGIGFQAADGETWIKSKSGFCGGSRLIQLTGKR